MAIPFLSKSVFPSPALMRAAADEVDRRSMLQQEKFLLHVAATRAKKLLRISWSGEPSALIVNAERKAYREPRPQLIES